MTTPHTAVFVCGIKGAISKESTVPNLIASDLQKLRDEGFDAPVHVLDENTPTAASVEEFRGLIAGKRYDGVSIGFGLRGNAQLTPLFEDLVNTVLAEIQPPPRLIFTEGIDKLYASVRRAFPETE